MKSTPSSTARRRTRRARAGSSGSPHTSLPGRRMAPKPMRWTSSSPSRMVEGRMVEGGLAELASSGRVASVMRRRCAAGARPPWAMLAVPVRPRGPRSRGAGLPHAAGVRARGDADDAAKVPVQLAFVVEAHILGGLGDPRAPLKQLAGARVAQVGQVLVRRQPHLAAEGAYQTELVQGSVRREVVQRDLVRQRLVQEGAG